MHSQSNWNQNSMLIWSRNIQYIIVSIQSIHASRLVTCNIIKLSCSLITDPRSRSFASTSQYVLLLFYLYYLFRWALTSKIYSLGDTTNCERPDLFRWIDGIKQYQKRLKVANWKELVEDRGSWRALTLTEKTLT